MVKITQTTASLTICPMEFLMQGREKNSVLCTEEHHFLAGLCKQRCHWTAHSALQLVF